MEKTFLLNVPISITNYDEVLKKIKESIIKMCIRDRLFI